MIVFLWGGIHAWGGKASPTVAYFRGVIVSFGFVSTLWPTDKGLQSRSHFRIKVPLDFLRAVMITRATAIEVANMPMYVSRVGTMAHYVAAFFIALVPWTNFVLTVRGKNRWAYYRFLAALSAGSMLSLVVVLRCTALGPHSRFPPRMRGSGFPFQTAVARPTFVLVLNALCTPATRQALARIADWMGLTHIPIQLSQIRTLTGSRDVWSVVQRLMHQRGGPSGRSDPSSDSPSTRSHHTAKLGIRDAARVQPAEAAYDPSSESTSESPSIRSHHTAKLCIRDGARTQPAEAAYVMTPAAAPEVPQAASEVPAARRRARSARPPSRPTSEPG